MIKLSGCSTFFFPLIKKYILNMKILFKIIFIIISAKQINGSTVKETPITNITKLVAEHYQSSCIIFLHTEQNYQTKQRDIILVTENLAKDLKYSVTVLALSFQKFMRTINNNCKVAQCNSPVILIYHNDKGTRKQLKEVNTPFDMQLIAVNVQDAESAELFEVYRVARNRPLRTPRLGQWTMEKGLEIPKEIVYNRRNDLEGIVLRTGSTQNYPIHWFEETTEGPVLQGYFPEVWRALESVLNFSSVNLPSVDKVTGMPEKGGNWSGLVGMLQRQEIDAAVSDFIMDIQRSHVVDFTRPLLKSSYQIFFKNVGNNLNWDSILRPFDTSVWLSVLFWILVAAVFLAICHSNSHRFGVEKYIRREDFNLINSIFFFVKALCNQGHTFVPSCTASRIIYLCAYLAAGVLFPSYSAALISNLTSKSPKRPFDDLQGLLDDGTYRLQTNAKTAEYTYFSEATNPLLQKIYQKLMNKIPENELPLNTREGLDKVCKNPHLAHFGDMAVAAPYLNAVNDVDNDCDIIYLRQPISTIYSCMALTRNSPFKSVINHILQKLEDTGVISEISDKAMSYTPKIRPSGWSEVEINDVIQIFFILLFGAAISLILFCIEKLCKKMEENETKKRKIEEKKRFAFKLQSIESQPKLKHFDRFILYKYAELI